MIVVKAPLRVSLFGGGSDLPSYFERDGKTGVVASMAIDRYVWCMIHPRTDDQIYLGYSKQEIVAKEALGEVQHEIFAAILPSLHGVDFEKGFEVKIMADIPDRGGSGLGSSSSFTVAVLKSLYEFFRIPKDTSALALDAARVEIGVLQKPIGLQDQYASAFGGFNEIRFSEAANKVDPLPNGMAPAFQSRLLLFDTGTVREGEHPLVSWKESVDVGGGVSGITDELVEIARVGIQAIKDSRWDDVGTYLHLSWEAKREAKGVTTDHINTLYSYALRHGAMGGKLCGAGGAGFLAFLTHEGRQGELIEAMSKAGCLHVPFSVDPYGARVVFNG